MTDSLLVINAGSSSIKFRLFSMNPGDDLQLQLRGQIEGIGTRPRLIAKGGEDEELVDEIFSASKVRSVADALASVVAFLRSHLEGALPKAIGHRVVHGGPEYSAPVVIDDDVLTTLTRLEPLAPLHQPNNLAAIRAIRVKHPDLPQVACFDTAFHRTHPEVADRYAIPEQLYAEGVRRYGFHGLSYEYVAGRLREIAPDAACGRVIVAHLGSGASMCALVGGVSVESTMGFTALDGLPMGTRPGQLDPGVLLYLLHSKRMVPADIQVLLYHECGLKALSGMSGDLRDLLPSPRKTAKLAVEYFAYKVATFFGMLAVAMGGVDALVFTAGIGENAPAIRRAVAEHLSWLGLELDDAANVAGHSLISSDTSRIACFVIPTNEELMIARHTLRVLRARERRPAEETSA